jgi:hypothetical protein
MKIAAIILAAAALAAPALAQDSTLASTSKMVAGVRLAGLKAYTPNRELKPAGPAGWRPVTSQEMAAALPEGGRKRSYAVSTRVDYNGDGIPDMAYLATNGKQGAVVVKLGGGKGDVLAFRASRPWAGGQELVAAGRRIGLIFPETSVVLLTSEGGKPSVYYPFEAEES